MNTLLSTHSVGSPFFYGIFFSIILIMIAIDMFTLKKTGSHHVSIREALTWSIIWVAVSLCFALWLYFELMSENSVQVASQTVLAFLTGYILEKSLAIDNIFVFLMIFSYFKIPTQYQHRVLLYGVLGAIILRAIMIGLGSILVQQFSWILYLFGIFLVYTGISMFQSDENEADLSDNKILAWITRYIPVSQSLAGEKFFIKENNQLLATPLFLVLIMVEISDIIFAVDSIPAVFAVTTDPFIVLTSNLFAVLGLRAMYFLLAHIVDRFIYLKYGLAFVLTFIGTKMLIIKWIHIPIALSLLVIFMALFTAIIASWIKDNVKQ